MIRWSLSRRARQETRTYHSSLARPYLDKFEEIVDPDGVRWLFNTEVKRCPVPSCSRLASSRGRVGTFLDGDLHVSVTLHTLLKRVTHSECDPVDRDLQCHTRVWPVCSASQAPSAHSTLGIGSPLTAALACQLCYIQNSDRLKENTVRGTLTLLYTKGMTHTNPPGS